MLTRPSSRDLEQVIEHSDGRALSIYMATHRAGAAKRQDPIRLRNLIKQAEQELAAADAGADDLLRPVRQLLDESLFMQGRHAGLAIFRDSDRMRVFATDAAPQELLVVDDRFFVRPLLADLYRSRRFYLLALSIKAVRCFGVDRQDWRAIKLPDAPASLAEARGVIEPDRAIQYHSGAAMHQPDGDRPAVFHGQGAAGDDALEKKYLNDFCHQLDRAMYRALDDRNLPLLLAGVDWIIASFRNVSTWPNIATPTVAGNVEHLSDQQVVDKAIEVMRDEYDSHQERAVARYRSAEAAGQTTDDVNQIVHSAAIGRIDSLLVAEEAHAWTQPPASPNDEPQPHEPRRLGDVDLIEHAVVDTLRRGGRVYPLGDNEMPVGRPVIATLRY